MNLTIVQGDITTRRVCAIVNAANAELRGRGGVDGAIHQAAGRGLQTELDLHYPGGCATGRAVITSGHNLPARFVIHAVGPVWRGGRSGEEEDLRSAYRSAMDLALRHRCRSVAFAAISTGVYGFPKVQAARLALEALAGYAQHPVEVEIVVFDEETTGVFQALVGTGVVPIRSKTPQAGRPAGYQVVHKGTVVGRADTREEADRIAAEFDADLAAGVTTGDGPEELEEEAEIEAEFEVVTDEPVQPVQGTLSL